MFSGKSEELMRRLRRVGYARKSAILIKPAVDDRYSVDEVVSHEGQRMAARVVRKPEAILELAAGCDVIGVDEGQFLADSLIDVCVRGPLPHLLPARLTLPSLSGALTASDRGPQMPCGSRRRMR